ncbi:MAG: LysR family transcriptional regulator [Bacteriovoracia bacterium]
MFNYNHLYYFYVTAKLGGVMKAAKALRIAQPALSSQIKTLETQIKRKLFQKSGRRLVLTAVGHRAFGFCRRAFEATEEFSDYLKYSDRNVRPRLKMGVSPEIERPFLSDALSAILREDPQSAQIPLVSMQTASAEVLTEKLRTRELDAVLTGKPFYSPEIKTAVEMQMPVVAVATPVFLRKVGISRQGTWPGLLKQWPQVGLVLPAEALRLRIETDVHLQKNRVRNPVVFESDILSAVIRAAVESAGIAFLPIPYIRAELKSGKLVVLGPGAPLWRHSVYFSVLGTKREPSLLDPIQRHFEAIARECRRDRPR